MKKKIAIIAALLVVIVGVGIMFMSQGTEPEDIVKKVAISCEEQSTDSLVDVLSNNSLIQEEFGRYIEDDIKEINEELGIAPGSKLKVNYTIEEISDAPDRYENEIVTAANYYSSDNFISEVIVADVVFSTETGEEVNFDIYIGFEDEEWKLLFVD